VSVHATDDPFGTSALRRSVLDGWAASPTRFREDANVEDDFARDGYRNQLLVELAQNAADAAFVGEVPGRLLLQLTQGALLAANTGRPLDVDGVRALASMRASAKRDARTVGRFGAGFAAVLSVTDEPTIVSRDGGVRFSAAATRDEVAAVPHLAEELTRRSGHLPVLRLPFAVGAGDTVVPDGYDTVVVLPLRDDEAHLAVKRLLDDLDAALLLALPALQEVVVDTTDRCRTLIAQREAAVVRLHDSDGADEFVTVWHTAERSGPLDQALLVGRPVEERQRPFWSVLWAVPVDDGRPTPLPTGVPSVLHAPTRSAEPISLPALLVASLPLDPSRRHVAPGPLASWIAEQAASGYADLVEQLAAELGSDALRLVPVGPAAGALDAAVRDHALDELRARPLVPLADDVGHRVAARDAARLEPSGAGLVAVVAQAYAGLADPAWAAARSAMDALGSPVLELADVLDALTTLHRPASWWRSLYEALDSARVDRAVLDGLPVPLVGGRVRRGVRGVVMSEGEAVDEALAVAAGLALVDPAAAHPLLGRLGAQPADPHALLAMPALLDAVSASGERADPAPLAAAVLRVVRDSGLTRLDERFADLVLPTADGAWEPAGSLVLAGSPLAEALGDPQCVADAWVERFGEETLGLVGVASTFPVRRHHDMPLEPAGVREVFPDGDEWADWVLDQLPHADFAPLVPELTVLERLADVRDDAWPEALQMLVEPSVRSAVVDPVRVLLPDGRGVDVVSPSAWWLRDAPLFGEVAPVDLRLPGSDPLLSGLFVDAPESAATVGAELLGALGVRHSLSDLLADADGPDDLLERLSDEDRIVGSGQLNTLYAALAALPPERWPQPRGRVRVPDGEGSRVVDADDVVVVLSPLHRPLVDRSALPGDARLAELLDVDSSEHLAEAEVQTQGARREVVPQVLEVLPGSSTTWWEHDDLVVAAHQVDAWVDAAGEVHACTTDGLARALSWAAGAWSSRRDVAAVLADGSTTDDVLVQRAYESWCDPEAPPEGVDPRR
jgi:hypothetical protein